MTPDLEQLAEYLRGARWFGGKGRPFTISDVRRIPLTLPNAEAPDGSAIEPVVTIELVTIAYDDGHADLYQVPLAAYTEEQHRLGHALVGVWDEPELGRVHAYDALHDREATAAWLTAFDRAETHGPLHFHRLPGHELDLEARSMLFSGEQSNSSVAFGEDSLMKVFRRITPGTNPDVQIHKVLTEAGNTHVAALYGWLEATDLDTDLTDPTDLTRAPLQLAMIQQFLRTASDGWDLALASVRNLFSEADLHADEVGGDFAGEAERLGVAVAEIHQVLAESFPTDTADPAETAAAMHARLDAALVDVPDLAASADAARSVFDRLAALPDPVTVQRIHGDLHLGQTLRTALGWKLVDFEGEPAKPLAERMLPDSPWRDVAGMLRSFDYAARAVERDLGHDAENAAQQAYRGDEWVTRNRAAFLQGYVGQLSESTEPDGAISALSDAERVLAHAYEADKAVYEAVYEVRNRPDWVSIPISALDRLASEEGEHR